MQKYIDNPDLLERARGGDKMAQDEIVKNNMGLVWSVVRRFMGRGYESDDLFQIGCVGLIKAVCRFDPGFEVQFSTYAIPMIIGEIKRFLRDDGMVKVSRSVKELAHKVRLASSAMCIELGREPTINELADEIGVSCEDIVLSMDACRLPESLSEPVGDNSLTLGDLLQGEGSEDDTVEKIALSDAVCLLNEQEKQIISLRYFKGRTQSETAAALGISQVQVSRMEKKILLRLREMIA